MMIVEEICLTVNMLAELSGSKLSTDIDTARIVGYKQVDVGVCSKFKSGIELLT